MQVDVILRVDYYEQKPYGKTHVWDTFDSIHQNAQGDAYAMCKGEQKVIIPKTDLIAVVPVIYSPKTCQMILK